MNALLNTYSLLTKDNQLVIIELASKQNKPKSSEETIGSHIDEGIRSSWHLSFDNRQEWYVTQFNSSNRDLLINLIKNSTSLELKSRFSLIS